MNTLREIQDNIIAVELEKDDMEKDQLKNKKITFKYSNIITKIK